MGSPSQRYGDTGAVRGAEQRRGQRSNGVQCMAQEEDIVLDCDCAEDKTKFGLSAC
jgi:hypothetical protein